MTKMREQKVVVSVIGGHKMTKETEQLAFKVGEMIAGLGAVLACGGLDGVMQASAQGAKSRGGLTIGILPGKNKKDANPYVDIALPTSIGYARNSIVACAADIIVALPGSHGTRSEISYGMVFGRPVIDLGNWNIEGMIKVNNTKEAEERIKECLERIK